MTSLSRSRAAGPRRVLHAAWPCRCSARLGAVAALALGVGALARDAHLTAVTALALGEKALARDALLDDVAAWHLALERSAVVSASGPSLFWPLALEHSLVRPASQALLLRPYALEHSPVTHESVPSLHLNRRYLALLKNGAALAPDEKKWLEDYRQRARELIDSIHERGRTIENVAREIFDVQHEFLEHGIMHLKPLVLREIAERLGKHESTISRATNGKYVQTPRGIFELKYFFSSSLESSGGGDMASSTSVRATIGEMIQGEDPARPLSDQKLSDMLAEDQLKVARRTVAKYREELGIPSSSQRKKRW